MKENPSTKRPYADKLNLVDCYGFRSFGRLLRIPYRRGEYVFIILDDHTLKTLRAGGQNSFKGRRERSPANLVTYRASASFAAPIEFVYEWCTDYREDDNRITGSKYPRIILEKTRDRAVYASYKTGQDGEPKLAVRVVSLYPSKHSWHLDYFGEEDLEVGEYRLTSLGKGRTRLDMVFKNSWKKGKGPSKEEFEEDTRGTWQKFVPALERDYRSARR